MKSIEKPHITIDKCQNRLAQEKSPYLLQHAHNPVDWYPWGDDAFTKAKTEDKPIFLSIGYSTCHWCHVMERESFEDSDVANILNRSFISIKVDREERPDVDHIYMTVCQAMTGHGGWPLTIMMTPEKKPFYAGTYFPKKSRMGMPGLMELLKNVEKAWKENREGLIDSSNEITKAVENSLIKEQSREEEVSLKSLDNAFRTMKSSFDPQYGGFGSAPKFPTPHNLIFLLRYGHARDQKDALTMVEKTLDSMYRGGIYDHIGFGFSRYSTDWKWLVPHFEKMLYDNALLVLVYLEAYQAIGKPQYRTIAEQIFKYIFEEMTSPEGGFYSAEDADSEGVEGKYYVWKPEEIIEVLGKEAGKEFCDLYHISSRGNFEGKNIPNLIDASESDLEKARSMDEYRLKLLQHRQKRVHPHKDDKILTSWNGLMIAALSYGARILGKEEYLEAAKKALYFIWSKLRREDGRLLARYRDGDASLLAYAEDYAFLIWGLIELYESSLEIEYLEKAIALNRDLIHYFWDEEHGGLFFYGKDGEELIARPKELYDGAMPSGNSAAALNFLRLARLTANMDLEEKARMQFAAFGEEVNQSPIAYTYFLIALLFASGPAKEIVIVGDKNTKDTEALLSVIRRQYLPLSVWALYLEGEQDTRILSLIPYLQGKTRIDGKAAAYVCQNFACNAPITDVQEFIDILKS